MPTGATVPSTPAQIKGKVREILAGISGIGKIARVVGEKPAWLDSPRPGMAFWEVFYRSAAYEQYAAVRHTTESPAIEIRGRLPWSEDGGSEEQWDTLVRAVVAALMVWIDLGDTADDVDLPQVEEWGDEPLPFSEERRELLVHQCRILLTVHYEFQHVRQ